MAHQAPNTQRGTKTTGRRIPATAGPRSSVSRTSCPLIFASRAFAARGEPAVAQEKAPQQPGETQQPRDRENRTATQSTFSAAFADRMTTKAAVPFELGASRSAVTSSPDAISTTVWAAHHRKDRRGNRARHRSNQTPSECQHRDAAQRLRAHSKAPNDAEMSTTYAMTSVICHRIPCPTVHEDIP